MNEIEKNSKIVKILFFFIAIILFIATMCFTPQIKDISLGDASIKQEDALSEQTEIVNFSAQLNQYEELSIPTYITKVKDTYFIVDCYNNQILFHDNLDDPLTTWKVMTSDVNRPHTLASDGDVYLIDDTENNRILVMKEAQNATGEKVFLATQEFTGIGIRPHYTLYDEKTATFYAWSSQTGEMYLFQRVHGTYEVKLIGIKSVHELNGIYVRSFTILGNDIYFVSGNSSIIKADKDSFKIKATYPVTNEIAGMVQITKIQNYFYITVSTDAAGNQDYATMIRVKKLEDLESGLYENIYDLFIGTGTPYNMTQIGNTWYLTEHRIPGVSIWSFEVKDDEIENVNLIY